MKRMKKKALRMSNHLLTDFLGDPNLGLFGFATDKYCLLGEGLKHYNEIEDVLGVKVIKTRILGTNLVGIFSAGNSKGVVVPSLAYDYEIENLRKELNVLVLESEYTALGNLILVNDNGCVLSPLLKKHKEELEKFFGVKCRVMKITKLNVVGSAAIANRHGCLVHPNTTDEEGEIIKKILKVKNVDVGTANFGSPFIGAGIIANSKGFLTSYHTTGPEMARIDEVLFK